MFARGTFDTVMEKGASDAAPDASEAIIFCGRKCAVVVQGSRDWEPGCTYIATDSADACGAAATPAPLGMRLPELTHPVTIGVAASHCPRLLTPFLSLQLSAATPRTYLSQPHCLAPN